MSTNVLTLGRNIANSDGTSGTTYHRLIAPRQSLGGFGGAERQDRRKIS